MAPVTAGSIDSTGEDWDRMFAVLSNHERRAILEYLDSRARPVSVRHLASVLADRNENVTTETSVSNDYRRIVADLHHTHLPSLEAAELVLRDHNKETVTLDPASRDLPLFSPVMCGLVHVDSATGSET